METRDIVERLRDWGAVRSPFSRATPLWPGDDMLEAAAELSRLRAEVERLREALDAIGKVAATAHRHRGNAGKEAFFLSVIEDRARKALEGGNE